MNRRSLIQGLLAVLGMGAATPKGRIVDAAIAYPEPEMIIPRTLGRSLGYQFYVRPGIKGHVVWYLGHDTKVVEVWINGEKVYGQPARDNLQGSSSDNSGYGYYISDENLQETAEAIVRALDGKS